MKGMYVMTTDKTTEKKKFKLNRTYSLSFRFLATVIFAMVAITVFVGGLCIYEVDAYIQNQAEDFVRVTCTNESSQMNANLKNMEKSVHIMESYLMDFFTEDSDIEDRAFQKKVIKSAEQMFVDVANHTSTDGAVSYYFRFDPEISDGKSGLFYSKMKGGSAFIHFEPTDITSYEKDDTEHVGWFWQPYEAGEPIWMDPYYNQNNETLMISYVIPMYVGERFIGVVGMDFDYLYLADMVHSIEIYENGFAHLELDGVITCEIENGAGQVAEVDPKEYMQVSEKLLNGMSLVLSASYGDIRQIRYDITFKIFLVGIILSGLFTIIAVCIVKKIVDPLKNLTDASVKLSNGDYNVDIAQSDTYEIKLLSAAFENMAICLREREELLHFSATRDPLTGLRNTTAFKGWLEEFIKKTEGKDIDYGVVVLDINDLKKANDSYGHDVGNELIVASSKIISDTFKRSPVFRIGGDEFLAILQNSDLESREQLFEQFVLTCANAKVNKSAKLPVKVAFGFARFDPSTDSGFKDVFKRADNAMYEHKRKLKEEA